MGMIHLHEPMSIAVCTDQPPRVRECPAWGGAWVMFHTRRERDRAFRPSAFRDQLTFRLIPCDHPLLDPGFHVRIGKLRDVPGYETRLSSVVCDADVSLPR